LRISIYQLAIISGRLLACLGMFSLAGIYDTQVPTAHIVWKGNVSPCSLAKPVLNDDLLFTGSCDGEFYALQKDTGKVVWSYDSHVDGEPDAFHSFPLLHKSLIIAGTVGKCATSNCGYIYAFDQHTGTIRWKVHVAATSDNFVDVDPADPNGSFIFGTREDEWLSVNTANGTVNWRFPATPARANPKSRTSVVTDGVNVCFLDSTGTVHCLKAKSGIELWKQTLPSPATTQLIMYKDGLYFGTADGRITGVDPENGHTGVTLKLSTTAVGGIVESDSDTKGEFEFAYGLDSAGEQRTLLAFSDEFGGVVWSQKSTQPWTSGEPEPWEELVIAGNCQGEFVAFRSENGATEWRSKIDGCIESFGHDKSNLYIAVRQGAIYSYHLSALSHDGTK